MKHGSVGIGVFLLAAGMTLLGTGCVSEQYETADLVLYNGKVVTVDEAGSEAQSLAVKDGKILAVGSDEQIRPYIQEGTESIDLEGRLAIPGFMEGHGHFMGLGNSKLVLDLTKPKNWDEIVALVADAARQAKPGEWIRGRGWHQDKWDKAPDPSFEGFPIHDSLSAASPDNPVVLTHASGHAAFVNAKAMEVSGIGADTKNPPGGEILRDKQGRATGLLRETAQGMLRDGDTRPAAEQEAEARKMVELAAQDCLSKGITSFQDAGSPFRTIDLFKKLADEKALPLRLWVMIRAPNDQLAEKLDAYRMIGYGDGFLTVKAIKVTLDGALGSRGAWLLEPYSDAPDSTGLNLVPVESVQQTARLAAQHDYQLCIHAIGDRANREVLDIYQQTFEAHPDKSGWRWRIEHAQHLNPADIPRFGKLGVIASMQGVHCTSDGPWVPDRLGDKRAEEGAYVWQKLMQTGAVVSNGTDAPVEDVNPIACYYSTVSRRMANGKVFYPDQRMSRMEALRSYTINVAFAGFEEDLKGSLEPGKLADITVLSKDILTIPEEEIPSTKVVYTIVGGKVAHRAQ